MVPHKLMIIFSSCMKNTIGILIEITLKLYISFRNMVILTMITLLIHEEGGFFHFFVSSSIHFINILQFSEYQYLLLWLDLLLLFYCF